MLARLSKELLDSASADTHEHLVEVRTRAEDEVTASLTGDGPRQEGLSGTRLTKEHDAFEELGALVTVQLRVLYYVDDVGDLVSDLIDAFNVIKALLDGLGHLDFELVNLSQWISSKDKLKQIVGSSQEESGSKILPEVWTEDFAPSLGTLTAFRRVTRLSVHSLVKALHIV